MNGPQSEETAAPGPQTDAGYGLDQGTAEACIEALRGGHGSEVRARIESLHAADIADLIGLLTPDDRRLLIEIVGTDLDPEVLTDLDDAVRDEVVRLLSPGELAAAVGALDSDDAVHLIEDLDQVKQREVLEAVAPEERLALEAGLAYPEDSAGRLMQSDYVAVPAFWTIGQTIDHLRESDDLPDEFHEIFVIDPTLHPIGNLPLNRAMRSKRPVVVGDIMDSAPRLIPATMDQEDVAFLFQQYDLVSGAVVDTDSRLVGVITVDDVVDVIHEEAEEDLMRLGGLTADQLYEPVLRSTRNRFPWLLINLGTAILASIVISLFDATIEQMVALAVLMPIVASMGGNAATQSLTVTVRALATRELTSTNAGRLLSKEVLVSLANGVLLALVIGIVAALWFGNGELGLVLGAAMIVNMVVAGFSGMLIPLGLDRIGVDPALAATVFVTTVTDVVGFCAFLGLAAWVLL